MAPPTPASAHRFHFLDGLRGVAAALVVLWHLPSYAYNRQGHRTFLAVDFFCCLSGFVVAFSYEKRLRSWLSLREFVLARCIRLYPMFLLALLLSWMTMGSGVGLGVSPARLLTSFASSLVMLPDYFARVAESGFLTDPPAWSVFFELAVSVVFAAVVRRGQAKSWQLGMFIAFAAWVYFRGQTDDQILEAGWRCTWHDFVLGLSRVGLSFCAGVLVMRAYRRAPHEASAGVQRLLLLGVTLALVLLLQTPAAVLRAWWMMILDVVVLFPAMVLAGAYVRVPRVLLPVCVFLGEVSYPLYLVHQPLERVLGAAAIASTGGHAALAEAQRALHAHMMAATMVGAVPLAYACLRMFDRPARATLTQRLRKTAEANDVRG